ncbi:unnamed protein product [Hymenolepis diminuta]|uniref:Uncharacterized protein n=1 Tax=Hymenolepis diminuta TaxID=6216 RepID=A0A564YNJ8_HYMDI|nr:unnamed protein product [Hymenolepis diminuta]
MKGNGERCDPKTSFKRTDSPRSNTMATNENPMDRVEFGGPEGGLTYLINVNSYSKWPEVVPLILTTSGSIIGALD